MLVSYSWLKELVDVPDAPVELANRLALTGTEVDAITKTGESLEGIVVGHILTKEKHPDADTLWVTTVDIGKEAPLQIVCGAQNFNAGDKVPVATVGTVMPGGMQIKKAKLRGIVSKGMNCSAQEIGLGSDVNGLMILPADAPVGVPFAEYWGIGDSVLDLDVTPNRPDCLSMVGVAREVGAIYDLDVHREERELIEKGAPVESAVSISIDDPELCPRYTARVIKNVKVGPSPSWLVERLAASGIRSINNIVDATNYILIELGQPLHAFDLDTIAKSTSGVAGITVRAAKDGEKITTLDEQGRTLTSDMVVIADAKGAVALAGVMGGLATEVTEKTTNILLESATFSTAHTSRTSRNLGLISEASLRYERGVDAAATAYNAGQAAALIAEIAGGEVCAGAVDVYPAPANSPVVDLSMANLQALIGEEIPENTVNQILTRLGCVVEGSGDLRVTVPTFRPDLTREADLIEEVLRIWGMERVTPMLPGGRERIGGLTPAQQTHNRIGALLRSAGLNETMTYAFTSPEALDALGMGANEGIPSVELLNPMSEEQAVLRTSILPGLVQSVAYNQSRGVKNVHLYETGTVFFAREGKKQPKEIQKIAGVLAGKWTDPSWNQSWPELDFFDGKGVLEDLFAGLGIEKMQYRPVDLAHLQPGRAAEIIIRGASIGWLGEMHPLVLEEFEAAGPVVAFEIDEAALITASREVRPVKEVPRFPAVELDAAFVVDESVTVEKIERAIRSAGKPLLDSIRLFDVYRSEAIGEGKKSMAFALSYRDPERTLTSEEVHARHERVIKKVSSAVGAELRGN